MSYEMPVLDGDIVHWRRFEAIDTSKGAYDYQSVIGEADYDYIDTIVRSAIEAGVGQAVSIVGVTCHLFPARPLVTYARAWIEHHFGTPAPITGSPRRTRGDEAAERL